MATVGLAPGETRVQTIVQAVRSLIKGGSNAVGTCTLTPNASSTTVEAPNCSPSSHPHLTPATAHAAAEIAAGTLYIPAATVLGGSFVIQHANNSQADRTFHFSTLG